jgi:hypothetical protein
MLKVPSWLVDVPLAHRGLHGDGVPENSLPAFAAAAAAGYGGELDVARRGAGPPRPLFPPSPPPPRPGTASSST